MTLQLAPRMGSPDAPPPKTPALEGYEDAAAQLKAGLHGELVSPKKWFECEIGLRGFPPISVHWVLIEGTAGILHLGRRPAGTDPQTRAQLLGACLLLGGFADADTAALTRARKLETQPGRLLFPPEVLADLADVSKAPRPLLVQLGTLP